MTQEELLKKYPTHKVQSQVEFDELMHAINNEQSIENHPYLDRLRELNRRQTLIHAEIQAMKVQLNAIKVERLEVEQKQKDINRMYYQLKHELIELNPKGLKNEKNNEET